MSLQEVIVSLKLSEKKDSVWDLTYASTRTWLLEGQATVEHYILVSSKML